MHSSNEVKAQLLVVLAGYETHQGRYISAVAEGASIAARGGERKESQSGEDPNHRSSPHVGRPLD